MGRVGEAVLDLVRVRVRVREGLGLGEGKPLGSSRTMVRVRVRGRGRVRVREAVVDHGVVRERLEHAKTLLALAGLGVRGLRLDEAVLLMVRVRVRVTVRIEG